MKFNFVESIENIQYKNIIAFHGSRDKIKKFDLKHIGDNIGTDAFDINGIYFFPSFDVALGYAVSENSSSYEDEDEDGNEVTINQEPSNGYIYTCRLNTKKPFVIDNQKDYEKYMGKTSELVKKGYDLVVHTNIIYKDPLHNNKIVQRDGKEYIVLDPKIIELLNISTHSPEEVGYKFNKRKGKWES